MGIKPMYVRHDYAADLVFGSELKAIFAHPESAQRLDLDALQDFLSLNYVPAPRAICTGNREAAPGHFLEYWRNGITAVTAYWKLSFAPDSRP